MASPLPRPSCAPRNESLPSWASQTGALPAPAAARLKGVMRAIEQHNLLDLRAAAKAMDWEALRQHNLRVVTSANASKAVHPVDRLLATLAVCVLPSAPAKGSESAQHEAFAAKALDTVVAAGYCALDVHDLSAVLMSQGRQARFTRLLARVGYRHGLRDAQGAAVLHHALLLGGIRPRHVSAAAAHARRAGQVNAQDADGNTVWHRWCLSRQLPLVAESLVALASQSMGALLQAGLDPSVRNADGLTGEDCLRRRGNDVSPAFVQAWELQKALHLAQGLAQTLPPSGGGRAPRF